MNRFGQVILPLVAQSSWLAALRRRLAKRPRLLAGMRTAIFWLSTRGSRPVLARNTNEQGSSESLAPRGCDHFSTILAINMAAAARAAQSGALANLMHDVFSTLPSTRFPDGAQITFSLLKSNGSIEEAIRAAQARGISDDDIKVGLHAFLLRTLPREKPATSFEADPFAFARTILGRCDFTAVRAGTRILRQ